MLVELTATECMVIKGEGSTGVYASSGKIDNSKGEISRKTTDTSSAIRKPITMHMNTAQKKLDIALKNFRKFRNISNL